VVEKASREAVAEVDDWGRKSDGDDRDERFEGNEDNGEEERKVLGDMETREEWDFEGHGRGWGGGYCLPGEGSKCTRQRFSMAHNFTVACAREHKQEQMQMQQRALCWEKQSS